MAAERRTFDHRIRDLVTDSGARRLASAIGIPGSTVASWKLRGSREVLTLAP
jgi:hypothetical protein